MMKQYCRYCGFCSEVDSGYYCGAHEKLMSESQIKRANNCKEYGYTDVGDIISGGQYHPRTLARIAGDTMVDHTAQISLFDGEGL